MCRFRRGRSLLRPFGAALALTLLIAGRETMSDQSRFTDYGIPAPVAERRNVAALRDGNGRDLVLATSLDLGDRGWILVTDLATGETEQLWCPQSVAASAPYGAMVSSDGVLYFGEGPALLGYDATARAWRDYGVPLPTEVYMSFTEAPGGLIYAGTFPGCRLVSLEPKAKRITDLGQMDPTEQYLMHLAMGSDGWLYGGVGTARMNIFAYNPVTAERRDMVPADQRAPGFADVFTGADGGTYGHIGDHSYRLEGGKAETVAAGAVPARRPGPGFYYGDILNLLPEGRQVTAYDMVDKWLGLADTKTGKTKRITFDYESAGTFAVFVDNGPQGKVWGCTSHPARPFSLDPATGAMERLPWSPYAWKALVEVDRRICGASYPGGILSLYDPTQPWRADGDPAARNPRELHAYEPDLNSPYVMLRHPDGRHVLAAGVPGYGYRGGGIGIYDLTTGEATLLKHDRLVPDQSIVSLAALPDGTVLAGSSVRAGHGVAAARAEAALCRLDWPSRQVAQRLVPVSGASEVASLAVGPDGLVYGLAVPTTLFVYDPAAGKVVHTHGLDAYGSPAWNPMKLGPDGLLYALTDRAILRIRPRSFEVEKLADAPVPITAGLAIGGGKLFFTSRSHVWGFALP